MYKCYVKEYMGRYGYDVNVTDLCDKVGITRMAFYNIVNSKSIPRIDTVIRLLDYLNRFYPQINDGEYEMWSVDDLFEVEPIEL